MKVRVHLYALARHLADCDTAELEVPDDATVAVVRRQLVARFPQLSCMMGQLWFALDAQYAADGQPVRPDAELACFPPVSGG